MSDITWRDAGEPHEYATKLSGIAKLMASKGMYTEATVLNNAASALDAFQERLDGDADTQTWHDHAGNVTETGAFDAAGHFHSERNTE